MVSMSRPRGLAKVVALISVLAVLSLATSASPPRVLGVAPAPGLGEQVFVVTTTADLPGTSCSSPCSLRQAIAAANAAPTRRLHPVRDR